MSTSMKLDRQHKLLVSETYGMALRRANTGGNNERVFPPKHFNTVVLRTEHDCAQVLTAQAQLWFNLDPEQKAKHLKVHRRLKTEVNEIWRKASDARLAKTHNGGKRKRTRRKLGRL